MSWKVLGYLVAIFIYISFWIGIGYVIIHFIQKFW